MIYELLSKALFRIEDFKARLAAVEAERDAARAASERDREWVGRALEKQAEYLGKSQILVAERDAARAGEARAVAALRAVVAGAYPLDNQPPALDWLAQQRRKAAAEALEKLATDLRQDQWESALHDVDSLRGILRTRAAALRAGEVGND